MSDHDQTLELRGAVNTCCANCSQRSPWQGKPGRGADICEKHGVALAMHEPFNPYNLVELAHAVCQWRLDNREEETP